MFHRLSLVWGVYPILSDEAASTDDIIEGAIATAQASKRVNDGDVVILTAGLPAGIPGSTNLMKVHTIGNVLARGIALGHGTIRGRVCLAKTIADCQQNFHQGDILVVKQTDHDYLPYMRLASALLCEDDRINCHISHRGSCAWAAAYIGVGRHHRHP